MQRIIKFLPFIIGVVLFKSWFVNKNIIGGDWPFFYPETLREFTLFISPWLTYHGNGLGGQPVSYALDSYLYFIVGLFVNTLHFPWEIVYRIFFFGLFIIISALSASFLFAVLFPRIGGFPSVISSIIYMSNTFILMLVGGGQMGVALAYACGPFVIANFILLTRENKKNNIYRTFLTALCLFAQVLFDPRIAYLTLVGAALYIVQFLILRKENRNLKRLFISLLEVFALTFLMHAYWLVPLLVYRQNPIEMVSYTYVSPKAFEFFSFATFSQALSLLHPNWPENIFGKVYFMKPEFIIFAILAFTSLFFTSRKNYNYVNSILYCLALAIIGVFLSKGAQEPFGSINIWLYNTIPGFSFFRDPTKFYLLTAFTYSMLIPVGLFSLVESIKAGKKKNLLEILVYGLFLVYFSFLIHPLWLGQLGGTFKQRNIPQDYIKLKDFITESDNFYRTLWVPRQHRFTFYSNKNPSIDAMAFFKASDAATTIQHLSQEETIQMLSDYSVRYIIVPYDDAGEIFVDDRQYSEAHYSKTVSQLSKIANLHPIKSFGKIKVFEIKEYMPHIYLSNGQPLNLSLHSTVEYPLSFRIDSPSELVFTDAYSSYWKLMLNDKEISSRGNGKRNIFGQIQPGDYSGKLYFNQIKLYYYVGLISFTTLLISICAILFLNKQSNRAI